MSKCMISALRRYRPEDQEFKTSFGYTSKFEMTLGYRIPQVGGKCEFIIAW